MSSDQEWLEYAQRARACFLSDKEAVAAVDFYAVIGHYDEPEKAKLAIREYLNWPEPGTEEAARDGDS